MRSPLSLDSLIDWLKTKDPEETFNFGSMENIERMRGLVYKVAMMKGGEVLKQ